MKAGVVYRKVMLGTDGSVRSRRASAVAATLAAAMGAEVLVVAVATDHGIPTMPWNVDEETGTVDRAAAEEWARRETAWLLEQGVSCDACVLDGRPAEILAKLAADEDVDLIVVGHRGRHAGQAPRIGSVAAELADLAGCPLLVVP